MTILSDTSEAFNGKNFYAFLQEKVTELLKDRNKLNQELERRIPLLQVGFVERLLSGTATDYTNLEGQLAELRLTLTGSCYCVAVLQITDWSMLEDEREGASLAQMVLEDLARHYAGRNAVIHANEEKRVTVIIGMNSPEEEAAVVQTCHVIIQQMKEQKIQMQAAVSAPYVFLADTFIAFAQAKRLLDNISAEESGALLTCHSYHGKATFYYFPTEVEVKLIRVMLSGNLDVVRSVFLELRRENIEIRCLAPATMKLLNEELVGAYSKILSALSDSGMTDEKLAPFYLYEAFSNGENDFSEIQNRFENLCVFIAGSRDERGDRLREHIQAYLDQHFADPNMSLAMLAEEFHVGEAYISRLFKENMAVTFSKYLERMRMDYAVELLKNGKKIVKVAEACGYGSSHAFRRAFKRYWGYLPSESGNK